MSSPQRIPPPPQPSKSDPLHRVRETLTLLIDLWKGQKIEKLDGVYVRYVCDGGDLNEKGPKIRPVVDSTGRYPVVPHMEIWEGSVDITNADPHGNIGPTNSYEVWSVIAIWVEDTGPSAVDRASTLWTEDVARVLRSSPDMVSGTTTRLMPNEAANVPQDPILCDVDALLVVQVALAAGETATIHYRYGIVANQARND